jgi:type I restriction-modification system DNA methylase subunit
MKKTKLDKSAKMPGPFEVTAKKTERSGVAVLMHWMRNIIDQKGLDLGLPDVDTSGQDNKSPDIVIYESENSQKAVCVIEAKLPYFDIFDEEQLREPARKKATSRGAKYFGVTNFQELIWFNTEKANGMKPLEEQIVDKYHLSSLEDIGQLENSKYKETIQKQLEDFLTQLLLISTGKAPEPKIAIDELLIYRLHTKIDRLSKYYTVIIEDKCHKDQIFSNQLKKWFNDQGWDFAWQRSYFDKAARQTAYLLTNKILFYDLLQNKRQAQLDPLEIPVSLTKGAFLQSTLEGYFKQVLKIDYDTVYTTDFIDAVAFPEEEAVVKEIKELVTALHQYDFSKLPYEIIGSIFQRLIPQDERHVLGQYFTNTDVVDVILKFCLQHETDKVLDPSCGAGTFLVRAYQHKKLMNQFLTHEQILDTLWGDDIAKFPAHLATINLATKDLSVDKNYPNILREDFFQLLSTNTGFEIPAKWRKARASSLHLKETEIEYPRWFDCIVGNPPYTRQEEISEIATKDVDYKGGMIENALKDDTGKQIAKISIRAGIHAYFFVHGTKFLHNGGRFGFVVSNSWMDVDYGKGLQEFFLLNYKIVAIIESKVERWFQDAEVNTGIIILEKCAGEDKASERNKNLARFAYLKKPLRYFIPAAQEMWQKEKERLDAIDKLTKTILAHNDFYENEDLRIYPKTQAELWDEGYDDEENKYVGSKWGKYLRAPQIFFTILLKGKDKLIPLRQIAKIRRGFTTGANEFFYLTESEIKKRDIEQEFWMHPDEKGNLVPNYVIKSPRECKSILVKPEDLKNRILLIHKDKKVLKGTNILRYINEGEQKGYHLRPSCSSRLLWYDLGERKPASLNINYLINEVARAYVGSIWASDDFQEIHSKTEIALFLNSSIFWLIQNIFGRTNFGGGLLKIQTYEFRQVPVCISKISSQSISKAFHNLAEDQ